jgi:hypothetical protein
MLMKFLVALTVLFSAFTQAELFTVTDDNPPKIMEFNENYIKSLQCGLLKGLNEKVLKLLSDPGTRYDIGFLSRKKAEFRVYRVIKAGDIALRFIGGANYRGGDIMIALQLSCSNNGQLRIVPYFDTKEIIQSWGTVIKPEHIKEAIDEVLNDGMLMVDSTNELIKQLPEHYRKHITNKIEDMISSVRIPNLANIK